MTTSRRRVGTAVGALLLLPGTALFAACGSSTQASPPRSVDRASTCTQATQENVTLGKTLQGLGDNPAAVAVVTKLDPIRGAFDRLAKSTSDPNLAGILGSESSDVNKIETGSTGGDAAGQDLTTQADSINQACDPASQPHSTLSTVPSNLSIPGETTTGS